MKKYFKVTEETVFQDREFPDNYYALSTIEFEKFRDLKNEYGGYEENIPKDKVVLAFRLSLIAESKSSEHYSIEELKEIPFQAFRIDTIGLWLSHN